MKKLPLKWRANRYNYTQIARTEKKAMYKSDGDFYEVFIIKVRPKETIFGREYPQREAYPGNEDFGKTAWCFSNKKNALRKYEEL